MAALATRHPAIDWRRVVPRVSQGVIAVEAAWVLFALAGGDPRVTHGQDYGIYRDAALRWLSGGGFYPGTPATPILYPPVDLWLLVPFTRLPAFLWWAVPCAISAWAIWRLRPAWWAWPIMALLAVWPDTPTVYLGGNPAMWAVAAMSLGGLYRWPSALVLLKPSLFPFALCGIRSRAWWFALGVLVLLSLPFGFGMWSDWLSAVGNAHGGLLYSLGQVPLLALPLVAWVARLPAARDPAGG